jgi:hypothetical protein
MSQRTMSSLFIFVENRLIDYGFSPQYAGFHYLAHAIHWSILDKQGSMNLSTTLYPCIAKSFCVTPSAVEHGIRNLLCSTWKYHASPLLTSLFSGFAVPPTNARCIALLTRSFRTQYFLAKRKIEGIKLDPPTVS